MESVSFQYNPNCPYLSSQNALSQSRLWIIVPGLNETPWRDPWISSYCEAIMQLGAGVISINPHWRPINDDVNASQYQAQLEELCEQWFTIHQNGQASIGFIGYSQGGCQTIMFLLTNPLIHKIIHHYPQLNLYPPILIDPYPPDEDLLANISCPLTNSNALKCIRDLLEKSCIFNVDGNISVGGIERLPIGAWTAELLGIKSSVLVTVNDVNHSDLPPVVLSDVIYWCQL